MFKPYTKKIYFIRHGALPADVENLVMGVSDVSLSERGFAQAKACGQFLKTVRFDMAYRGTLQRVSQTYYTAKQEMEFLPEAQTDLRLNEIDFGRWCYKSISEIQTSDFDLFKKWDFKMDKMDFAFPEGESIAHFTQRTREVFQMICQGKGKNIAVFSHGGVIMSLLCDIVGLSRVSCFSIWLDRGCIACVEVNETGIGRLTHMIEPLNDSL